MTKIKEKGSLRVLILFLAALIATLSLYFWIGKMSDVEFDVHTSSSTPPHLRASSTVLAASTTAKINGIPEIEVTHLPIPTPLYAAYMTSCIASGKTLRTHMLKLLETTELNAVVIDIKDFSGKLSIDTGDPHFILNNNGCAIPDIKTLIAELHQKHIYVIGRVTVMQDNTYPKTHPLSAVQSKSTGGIWHDKKGISFIDPGATEYWQYMIDLGKASHALGFDEINYDYIRYPSDGDMSDAKFSRSASTSKAEMMKRFYSYLGKGMHEAGIPISADLFGMTTSNTDDLGIGQVLENALPNFDYVAPMVYPSHYPPNFNGWKDPNMVPYDIIKFSMSKGVERANELEKTESGWKPIITTVSSTTGQVSTSTNTKFVPTGKYSRRLRPWIQDFNYGKVYTEADVRAQKKGVYDAGLTSWMVWNPKNLYTTSAYDPSIAIGMPTSTSGN